MLDKEKKLKRAYSAVNSQSWLEFEIWLEEELQETYERMSNLVDTHEVYRTQGHIKFIKQLLDLRKNTNTSAKVINGRENRKAL